MDTVLINRPGNVIAGDIWRQSIIEILGWERSIDTSDGVFYAKEDFLDVLESKSKDYHYPEVLASIRERGFVRPVTVVIKDGVPYCFGDGHHRLMAAIELGYEYLPVEACTSEYDCVARDSGDWDKRTDPVALSNGVN